MTVLETRRLKYAVDGCVNGIWGDEPNGIDDHVVVRVADFDRERGRVVLGESPTVRAIPSSARGNRLLSIGDLLIEKSGGGEHQPVGNVVLFNDDIPAVCSNFVARMPVSEDCDSRYVGYVFRALYMQGRNIPHVKQTSGIQNLDSQSYLNEKAWLPALTKQQRIANFLDEQTARIDELIAGKQRLYDTLAEHCTAVISSAIGGVRVPGLEVSEVSQWRPTRLKYKVELNPSVRMDLLEKQDTEVSFLPMESLGEDGSLRLERLRPVHEVRSGYSFFENGDVVFAKVTPCFENGKGAVMQNLAHGAGFGTTEITVLRPKEGTDARYLDYVLRSYRFRKEGVGHMTGAGGLKRVPDEFVKNYSLVWPPIEVQIKISNFLDSQVASISLLREQIDENIERLREYRSSLISAAVNSQIDINNFQIEAA